MTDKLKALAAELDEIGGRGGAIEDDELPDLSSEDFKLTSPIGGGGMGSVYMAEQISLGRRVAVKLVRSVGNACVPDEARMAAHLHHPNIVHVYAAGRSGDFLWMAMELADGESAERHAFRSAEEIARFGISVAEEIARRLADRFPEDESMSEAVEAIRKARERRAASLLERPPARRRR